MPEENEYKEYTITTNGSVFIQVSPLKRVFFFKTNGTEGNLIMELDQPEVCKLAEILIELC